MVKLHSVKEMSDGHLEFVITDFHHDIAVYYKGIVPMLFKEESSAVVLGEFKGGVFYAKEILAKHDENYIPKEILESIKGCPDFIDQ